MSDVDQVASISAARHSRSECVTASTDSVDFYIPFVQQIQCVLYLMWHGPAHLQWRFL